jgi:hypothetical protein
MEVSNPMNSGDLIPSDPDRPDPDSAEVEFALVIARMIDSVRNSPEHMRQAIYDLARYKLQEQFTYADAKDVKRTQQALETAIRGVEAFSKQHARIPAPAPPPLLGDAEPAPAALPPPELISQIRPRPRLELGPKPDSDGPKLTGVPWPHLKRTAAMIAIVVGILVAVQQRERLLSLAHNLPKFERQTAIVEQRSAPAQVSNDPVAVPAPPPAKPMPLRPTDYGVYAVSDDALFEMHLLPGRALDARVAVSAAFGTPSQTVLPNGHPKFIVFRRDVASIADHADVRIVAKIAREFSADVAGKKPNDGDGTWVIRNISFPFRISPINDNSEMYELHSEDPTLELTPGRYALVVKNQSYDFSIEGVAVDPRQCIERIVSSNGTFYTDCKKP